MINREFHCSGTHQPTSRRPSSSNLWPLPASASLLPPLSSRRVGSARGSWLARKPTFHLQGQQPAGRLRLTPARLWQQRRVMQLGKAVCWAVQQGMACQPPAAQRLGRPSIGQQLTSLLCTAATPRRPSGHATHELAPSGMHPGLTNQQRIAMQGKQQVKALLTRWAPA